MVSMFEFSTNLLALAKSINGGDRAYAVRVYRTLEHVRASCESDALPPWLTRMVIEQVQAAMIAGTFPLLPFPDELTLTRTEHAVS